MSFREPPPYSDSSELENMHRVLQQSDVTSRKSMTGPRGGKPSPSTNVAEVYLTAVENNAEQAHRAVVRRRPKAIESAVKAARVTAGNNKRHSGSYSAAPCSKQMTVNRPNDPGMETSAGSDDLRLFQQDSAVEKTISTSPVPVRRSLKKGNSKNIKHAYVFLLLCSL